MRCFNYSECENTEKLFKFLKECLDEGYFNYNINDVDEEVEITNYTIEDDDEIYDSLVKKYDVIEDVDFEDFSDDTYDDFYDSDNMEDN